VIDEKVLVECDETRCRDRGAPAFRASSASSQQFSSRNAFLCFQWFGPLTIVHSNLNASDICTVGAQSFFGSLASGFPDFGPLKIKPSDGNCFR
jgi:hypothetical protein